MSKEELIIEQENKNIKFSSLDTDGEMEVEIETTELSYFYLNIDEIKELKEHLDYILENA